MKPTAPNPAADKAAVLRVVALVHRRATSVSLKEARRVYGDGAVRLAAASGYVRSDGRVLRLTERAKSEIVPLYEEAKRRRDEEAAAAVIAAAERLAGAAEATEKEKPL